MISAEVGQPCPRNMSHNRYGGGTIMNSNVKVNMRFARMLP